MEEGDKVRDNSINFLQSLHLFMDTYFFEWIRGLRIGNFSEVFIRHKSGKNKKNRETHILRLPVYLGPDEKLNWKMFRYAVP